MVQTNVYHFCVHTQRISLPSINPNCQKKVLGRDYIMSQWCPRCRWTGFLTPFEYQEYAEGLPCDGHTGKVMRTVTLNPAEFVERQKEQLWLGRQNHLLKPIWDFRQAQRELEFERLREREIAAGVSDRDRSYFMDEFLPDYPNENRCEDFFKEVWPDEVPEDKDICTICRQSMNTTDDDQRCESGEIICVLPCGHYYGLGCIAGWLGNGVNNTCPECRQKYNFVPQLNEAQRKQVPRGWNDQERTDFAPDHEIRTIHFKLMCTYFGKLALVGILFAPFPVCACVLQLVPRFKFTLAIKILTWWASSSQAGRIFGCSHSAQLSSTVPVSNL